jgi:hypothetical protein
MDFPPSSDGCKQELRPPPCPVCGVIGWWNGWVFVAQMVVGEAGTVERVPDQPRHRARCKAPECPCGSWTIYEAGGYPHRTFTLAVTAAAVAELAIAANASLSDKAVIELVDKAGKPDKVNYELENGCYLISKVLRPGEKWRLIFGKEQAWIRLK